MKEIINVSNLNKSFDTNHVLKGISFQVNQIGRASCRERV